MELQNTRNKLPFSKLNVEKCFVIVLRTTGSSMPFCGPFWLSHGRVMDLSIKDVM